MFSWIEARTHCHATEDEDKVGRTIELFCPRVNVAVGRTEGYNRNPILVMTARTDSQRVIKDFWRMLADQNVINIVLAYGGRIIDDDWVMHLRFSKQDAFNGKAMLTEQEDAVSIRLRISRIPPRNRDAFAIAKEAIQELTTRHVPDS